jgi:hypothetical protein
VSSSSSTFDSSATGGNELVLLSRWMYWAEVGRLPRRAYRVVVGETGENGTSLSEELESEEMEALR